MTPNIYSMFALRRQGTPMHYEVRKGEITINTDPARLDVEVIHAFLSRSYWAEGIPKEMVERSLRGSICFGVYKAGRQVGFARVISDCATFAYLADVFILKSHRGKGLSKLLMKAILVHPELQGLRLWCLVTRNAHGLYRQFGFKALRHPENYMEIRRADIYSTRMRGGAAGGRRRQAPSSRKEISSS
jgi:GNAT superfamily N-acetyltransferase